MIHRVVVCSFLILWKERLQIDRTLFTFIYAIFKVVVILLGCEFLIGHKRKVPKIIRYEALASLGDNAMNKIIKKEE